MNVQLDPLTGLLSYKLIPAYLAQYSQCSIIVLDIDQFCMFNACYGHTQGDQALITVTRVIQQVVPEPCNVFRSGGDEFTILMERSPTDQVIQLAHQISNTVKEQFAHLPGGQWFNVLPDSPNARMQSIPFTVSCGIAFYPDHGQEIQQLRQVIDESVFDQREGDVVAVAQLSHEF